MGNYMEEQIEILKREHPSIGDFRNTGLLGCLELVKNKKSKEPMVSFNAKPEDLKVMDKVKAKISKLGMYTFSKWSYIFIAPPLCINKNEIDEGLAIISKALKIADRTCE